MSDKNIFTLSVDENGAFVIPEEVRKALGVTDKINMDLDGNSVVLSRP